MDSGIGIMGHSKQVGVYEHGLFSPSDIESSQKIEYRPMTSVTDDGPVEFNIPPTPGKIFDVHSMTLFGKMGIRKLKAGTTNEWEKLVVADLNNVGVINNIYQSLWESVGIKVNDTEIENNNYHVGAYLQTLCGAQESAQKTIMERRLFIKDPYNKWDSLDAESANYKRGANFKNEWTQFVVPLYNDLQTTVGNYLPPNTKMTVTLRRSSNDFCLMKQGTGTYKIVLDDLRLKMMVMTPSAAALNRFNTRYKTKGPKVTYTKNVLKTYTVPAGNFDLSCHNLFFGDRLPDQVFVAMVDQEAFSGDTAQNPYQFKHFDLTTASLVVNGVSEPSIPYSFDKTHDNISLYYELLENTGTRPFENESINITPLEFRAGYFILAWDRNPVKNNRLGPTRMDGGYMSVRMKTKTALADNITVLVFGSYINDMEFKNDSVKIENHF